MKKILTYLVLLFLGISLGAGITFYLLEKNPFYTPKETPLAPSEVSIDLTQPSWSEGGDKLNVDIIARNTSNSSIDGEIIFEITLNPTYLNLEFYKNKIKEYGNKYDLVEESKKRLDLIKDKSSREYQAFNVILELVSTDLHRDEEYASLNLPTEKSKVYHVRVGKHASLRRLESKTFEFRIPIPDGYGRSMVSVKAVSIIK